jgi:PAS domain S-box-containing protein
VKVAAQVCGTPVALISLVDERRQWFKACVGFDGVTELPREIAFCDHTIRQRSPLIIEDATQDPRFADNPLVTGPAGLRFYAGVPLWTQDGYCLGALCVVDKIPHSLNQGQVGALQALARQTVTALELRSTKAEAELDQLQAKYDRERLFETTRVIGVGIYNLDKDGKCTFVNDAFCRHMGLKRDQALGYGYMSTVIEPDRFDLFEKAQASRLARKPFHGVWRVKQDDGRIRHLECISEPDYQGGRVGVTYDVTEYVERVSALEKELLELRGPMIRKAE